jgi:hypothetical protein
LTWTVLWYLAVAPPVVAVLLCAARPARGPLRRFVSGVPLGGGYVTDATFTRHPTKVRHPRGRLSLEKWHWRPGWHRAAARIAAVYAAEFLAAALLLATTGALVALAVLAAAAVARGGWWIHGKVRRWWPSTSR